MVIVNSLTSDFVLENKIWDGNNSMIYESYNNIYDKPILIKFLKSSNYEQIKREIFTLNILKNKSQNCAQLISYGKYISDKKHLILVIIIRF